MYNNKIIKAQGGIVLPSDLTLGTPAINISDVVSDLRQYGTKTWEDVVKYGSKAGSAARTIARMTPTVDAVAVTSMAPFVPLALVGNAAFKTYENPYNTAVARGMRKAQEIQNTLATQERMARIRQRQAEDRQRNIDIENAYATALSNGPLAWGNTMGGETEVFEYNPYRGTIRARVTDKKGNVLEGWFPETNYVSPHGRNLSDYVDATITYKGRGKFKANLDNATFDYQYLVPGEEIEDYRPINTKNPAWLQPVSILPMDLLMTANSSDNGTQESSEAKDQSSENHSSATPPQDPKDPFYKNWKNKVFSKSNLNGIENIVRKFTNPITGGKWNFTNNLLEMWLEHLAVNMAYDWATGKPFTIPDLKYRYFDSAKTAPQKTEKDQSNENENYEKESENTGVSKADSDYYSDL